MRFPRATRLRANQQSRRCDCPRCAGACPRCGAGARLPWSWSAAEPCSCYRTGVSPAPTTVSRIARPAGEFAAPEPAGTPEPTTEARNPRKPGGFAASWRCPRGSQCRCTRRSVPGRLASAVGSAVEGWLLVRARGGRFLSVRSVRDDHAGPPARRAPSLRRLDRLGVNPAARDHPRDHGVRVPHLTRAKLITAPHRGGHPRDHVKHPAGALLVVAEPPGAVDGLGDVWYIATASRAIGPPSASRCPARRARAGVGRRAAGRLSTTSAVQATQGCVGSSWP